MKRFLLFLLVFVIAISSLLIGCGKQDEKASTTTSTGSIEKSGAAISTEAYEKWEDSFEQAPNAELLPGQWKNSKKATDEYVFRTVPENIERPMVGKVYTVGYPIVKDKVTLKVFSIQDPNIQNIATNFMNVNLEKTTNVKIEWSLNSADTIVEKRNVLLASGDMPDIFFGTGLSNAELMNFGAKSQLLIPLNDLLDKFAPNFNKYASGWPVLKPLMTAPDGNIYSLAATYYNYQVSYATRSWLNTKWLNKVGLKMPTTTDEFEAVLKAFKTSDANGNGKADEIPYIGIPSSNGGWNADILNYLINPFIVNTLNHLLVTDGRVKYAPNEPEYKQALQWLNKLFNEKLIGVDVFTISADKAKQLGDNPGVEILGGFAGASCFDYMTDDAIKNPRVAEYGCMPPLKGPSGNSYTAYYPYSIITGVASISSMCKEPEIAIRWLDWFNSFEAELFNWYGHQGSDWDYANKGELTASGEQAIIKDIKMVNTSPQNTFLNPLGGNYIDVNFDYMYNDSNPLNYNNIVSKAVKEMYEGHQMKEVFPTGLTFANADDSNREAQIGTPLNEYVKQETAAFIIGKKNFDNDYNAYLKKLKDMGLDEYLQISQKQYDVFKNNMK